MPHLEPPPGGREGALDPTVGRPDHHVPGLRIALPARGSDPDLEAFSATVDAERLAGSTAAVRDWAERGWLRTDVDKARDVVWTLNSPAVWVLLTDRGWSPDEYQEWIAEGLRALVFRAPAG